MYRQPPVQNNTTSASPADLTYAGYGNRIDLSDEARTTFQKYYGAGLDPARFVIQRGWMSPWIRPRPMTTRSLV